MMRRDHCLAALFPHIADDVVISVYSAANDWLKLRPDHPLNFNSVGAMGLASSHGLGMALARPDRRIVVLDGDGSLLMNLGCLATIGAVAPANLYHFVCKNGTYEANGGHPIPNRERLRFADIADAAGYRHSHCFAELDRFKAGIGPALAEPGPVFVELDMVPGEPFAPTPDYYQRLYSEESRQMFRAAFRRR